MVFGGFLMRFAAGGWTGWEWDERGAVYLFDAESGELKQRIAKREAGGEWGCWRSEKTRQSVSIGDSRAMTRCE